MKSKDSVKKEPLISGHKINKYYGKNHALKDLDFEVYPGEILGLIGDNGAGKSTLIKIISGVIPKNSGQICWKGKEVNITSVKQAINLGIETVYQDRAVVGCLSVAQNIFLGREPVFSWGPFKFLNKKKMCQETSKLAHNLKLNIPSPDQEVRFCSGGEMQGTAISRAMYFKAELVVLDEPTTALAISGVQKVLAFVEQLKKENIASIFVTHNLHHVYAAADRFLVMAQGGKVAEAKKEEIDVEGLTNLQLRKNEENISN